MNGEQLVTEMKLDVVLSGPDFDMLTSVHGRHPVTGPVEAYKPIPSDLSFLHEELSWPGAAREGLQCLGCSQVTRTLVRSAMSAAADFLAPGPGLVVELAQSGELATGPEVALYVLDRSFHPALGLGPVGAAQLRLEPRGEGEIHKPGMPDRSPLLVRSESDRLQIVLQEPLRHAGKVLQGVDVTAQERGQVRSLGKLQVDISRKTEHPDEAVDMTLLALRVDVLEHSPVDLSLLPWLHLKPHDRRRPAGSAQRVDELTQDGGLAGIALVWISSSRTAQLVMPSPKRVRI